MYIDTNGDQIYNDTFFFLKEPAQKEAKQPRKLLKVHFTTEYSGCSSVWEVIVIIRDLTHLQCNDSVVFVSITSVSVSMQLAQLVYVHISLISRWDIHFIRMDFL